MVLNEVNKSPGAEPALGLPCISAQIVNTPEIDPNVRHGPGFGTFIGSRSWNPNTDSLKVSEKFEIVSMRRVLSPTCSLAVIGMYRSPNQDTTQLISFYRELEEFVTSCRDCDIILICGDDNSHSTGSGSLPKKAYQMLNALLKRQDGVHILTEKTLKSHQPDHVCAIYDPLRFTIVTSTLPGLGDHREIRVTIDISKVVIPREKWVTRWEVHDHGDDEIMDQELRNSFVYSDAEVWETYNNHGFTFSSVDVDNLARQFMETVTRVRLEQRTMVRRSRPVVPTYTRSKHDQALAFIDNKISRTYLRLRKDDNVDDKAKLHELRTERDKLLKNAVRTQVEREMNKMRYDSKVNVNRFYELTKNYMKFTGMSILSDTDKMQKLTDAESNYLSKGHDLSVEDYCDITPLNTFVLSFDTTTVVETIKRLKNIDPFYKTHAEAIAPGLAGILYVMNKAHAFPNPCKISKLTFLTDRTIFSLDFLAKFLEAVSRDAFDKVMPPDTAGQFAYQKSKSAELLVAIGLNKVEMTNEPVIGLGMDQVKAFDSADWATIASEMQHKAGAGKFIHSYLVGRTYSYDSYIGFKNQPMGSGVMPGSILGPDLFAAFQATDTSMSLENKIWIWPGWYADDKNPYASWRHVLDGGVQTALDDTWRWSIEKRIRYHVVGKKKPTVFVIRRPSDATDFNALEDLNLGGNPVTRVYENTQLGISHKFYRDDEIPNAYGYRLHWNTAKKSLGRLAHQFDDLKYWWDPEFIRKAVQSYMVGKLNYASALYWLRAEKNDIEEVRFLYSMALSAALGLETPEVVSMTCCKRKRVSATNAGFKKACRALNLPTLRDMAIKNARIIIRQWSAYEPELFLWDESTVSGVADESNRLLCELFDLSQATPDVFLEEYESARRKKKLDRLSLSKYPIWHQQIVASKREHKPPDGSTYTNHREVINTYVLLSRAHFNVLEPTIRRKRRLDDLHDYVPYKKRKCHADRIETIHSTVTDIEILRSKLCSRKSVKPAEMRKLKASCKCIPKEVVSKSNSRVCMICGFQVMPSSIQTKMKCCRKFAHAVCWARLKCPNSKKWPLCYDFVNSELFTPSATVAAVTTTGTIPKDGSDTRSPEQLPKCVYCKKRITMDDRDHLMHCRALDSRPIRQAEPSISRLATRLAGATRVHRVSNKLT